MRARRARLVLCFLLCPRLLLWMVFALPTSSEASEGLPLPLMQWMLM